jgi:cytochrome c biogenesis protein CcmG/thiol:disulfide interchange protein DsbE
MMANNRFERTIILLLLAILGGAWITYSREPVNSAADVLMTEAPIVGHLAPAFTLQTPLGESVSLNDFVDRQGLGGQPVVLNYWASWCGPCRIETPQFQNASVKYKNQIAILGINQGEPASTVTEFGLSYGLTYPLLVDADNRVSRLYNVISLPTTIFIDRQGIVQKVFIGMLSAAVLEEHLNGLLAADQ